ncbi:unnamed protein product [Didymodactylos carnosus]|uniref:Transcription elongation factor SPT5 n=1 Tax=Didymodactylos carnosus TaxID=1234261 RepID=A0A8S2WDM0_9BILA|nr:unnamed protein product [Didymodactylos carnosus]
MVGSGTPHYDGSRTPHYGNMTPRHDGSMTPAGGGRASAWDPSYGATPRVDYDDDEPSPYQNLNPITPSYSHIDSNIPPTSAASALSLNQNTFSPYSQHTTASPGIDYQPYSSHIPTPGSDSYRAPDQSPATYVYSPSVNMTPVTPSAQYTPMPTRVDYDSSLNDWHTEGLVVRFKDQSDDIMVGSTGIIHSINGNICTIHVEKFDKKVAIQLDRIEPVVPKQNDKVYVISGDYKGASGDLLSVDYQDSVIKLHENSSLEDNITMINLRYLSKWV